MRLALLTLLVTLSGCVLAEAALAEPEKEAEVLTRLARAERETPYAGILVTRESGPGHGFVRVTKQRLWHAPGGRFRLEPIEPKELADSFMVDDGTQIYHVFPKRNEYSVRPSAGSWLVGPILRRLEGVDRPRLRAAIHEFIERSGFKLLGEEKQVAGRTAFGVAFAPPPPPDGPGGRGPGRPHRRDHSPMRDGPEGPPPGDRPPMRATLWIDKEKFVVLAAERRAPDGDVVSESRFESIRFPGEIDPDLFVWKPKAGMKEIVPEMGRMPLARAAKKMGFRIVRPSYLAGYAPEDKDSVDIVPFPDRDRHDGEIAVALIRYRKGGSMLSFFQSSIRPLVRAIQDKGKLEAKVRQLERDGEWDDRDRSYTWIAGKGNERRLLRLQAPSDMPRETVEKIANSVNL